MKAHARHRRQTPEAIGQQYEVVLMSYRFACLEMLAAGVKIQEPLLDVLGDKV